MNYKEVKALNERNKVAYLRKDGTVEKIEYANRGRNRITFKKQGVNINIDIAQLVKDIKQGNCYVTNLSYLIHDIEKLDTNDSFYKIIDSLEESIYQKKAIGEKAVFLAYIHGKDAYLGNKSLYEKVREHFLAAGYMILAKPEQFINGKVIEQSEYIIW